MPWRGVVKLPGAGRRRPRPRDRARAVARQPGAHRARAGRRTAGDARRVRPDHPLHGLGRRARRPRDEPPRHEGARRGLVGIVGAGRTADLADGAALPEGEDGSGSTISFPELRQYSVLQVARDPGCPSCWPPLSSSSWDCCPRCTAPGARSGCGRPGRRWSVLVGRRSSRCSASRSSRRSSPARRLRRRRRTCDGAGRSRGSTGWRCVSTDRSGPACRTTRSTWPCSHTSRRCSARSSSSPSSGRRSGQVRRWPRPWASPRTWSRSWAGASRPTGCRGATCTSTRSARVPGRAGRISSSSRGVARVRPLTGFVLMFSVLTMAVAVLFLYVGPGPLVPALNSYWDQDPRAGSRSGLVALRARRHRDDRLPRGRPRRGAPEAMACPDPPPIMGGAMTSTPIPHFEPGRSCPTRPRTPDPARGAARALGRRPRPSRLPHHRGRLPDLDVRGDRRSDLGPGSVGPLLGWDPEGDVVVHHLGGLRRVPARSGDERLEGTPSGGRSRSSGSSRC